MVFSGDFDFSTFIDKRQIDIKLAKKLGKLNLFYVSFSNCILLGLTNKMELDITEKKDKKEKKHITLMFDGQTKHYFTLDMLLILVINIISILIYTDKNEEDYGVDSIDSQEDISEDDDSNQSESE